VHIVAVTSKRPASASLPGTTHAHKTSTIDHQQESGSNTAFIITGYGNNTNSQVHDAHDSHSSYSNAPANVVYDAHYGHVRAGRDSATSGLVSVRQRPDSGGVRPDSRGVRPDSGGVRPDSRGVRPDSGGVRRTEYAANQRMNAGAEYSDEDIGIVEVDGKNMIVCVCVCIYVRVCVSMCIYTR
jgi:hypothetical protein